MANNYLLTGAWRLLSWTTAYSDNRPSAQPFGSKPEGLLVYTEAGWMSGAIVDQRQQPTLEEGTGVRSQSDALLAQAYRSYFHYAGPYRIDGDTVFHTVTQSLNPNLVGSVQERHVQREDNQLSLSGNEEISGVERTHTLVWTLIS